MAAIDPRMLEDMPNLGLEELLPCPFCGCQAEIDYCDEGCCGALPRSVECTNLQCGLEWFTVIAKNDAEAIRQWNTRYKG